MAGENTVSSMDGLYKEVYADTLNDVVPNSSVLYDLVKFDDGNRMGDSFHQGVVLTMEHGFTYNGSAGGVATLAAPIQATLKDASTSGFEMIGRSKMTYAAASRAAAAGKAAFKQAWGTLLLNLRKASMKRLELQLGYGQQGLGVVSSIASGVITISDATWSPATWAGMEGAILEAFTGTTATETQHNGDLTISAVSYANKTITVTGTSSAVAANDVLYFKGARTATAFNEMPGLMKIAANTGTLFGISGASYALWTGNTSSSFGTPTMGKYLAAVTDQVDRGLDEKVYLGVPPRAWEVLNADLAGNREYDGSYSKSKAENGSQAISYYGQAGEIETRSMPFLRRGDSVLFPKSCLKRVGSADMGMGVPGTDGRDVFFHVSTDNAVEARSFTDQALWCDAPAHCSFITGITYP